MKNKVILFASLIVVVVILFAVYKYLECPEYIDCMPKINSDGSNFKQECSVKGFCSIKTQIVH